MWSSGCMYFFFSNNVAILSCNDLNSTWYELNPPYHVQVVLVFTAYSLRLAIYEKFNLIGIVVIAPHIYFLSFSPVPVREQVQYLFVCPFCLIQIINVFRETCQIDDSKVGTSCRPSVWSWFAYIVKSCPDVLSADKIIISYQFYVFLVSVTPWNMAVLI